MEINSLERLVKHKIQDYGIIINVHPWRRTDLSKDILQRWMERFARRNNLVSGDIIIEVEDFYKSELRRMKFGRWLIRAFMGDSTLTKDLINYAVDKRQDVVYTIKIEPLEGIWSQAFITNV